MQQTEKVLTWRTKVSHSNRTLRHMAWIFTLCALAYVGNSVSLPVTLGTYFRLGGIASIIAALTLRWPLAIAIAVVGSLGVQKTPYLWSEILLAASEVAFVAVTYRRFWHNAIVATAIFWLLPGTLVVGIIHAISSESNLPEFLLIWSTQCINGILNALIASAVLISLSLFRQPQMKLRLQEAIFNTLIAMSFLPILMVVLYASRSQLKSIADHIHKDTLNQAKNVAQFLSLWKEQNLHAIQALADTASKRGIKNSIHLQEDLRLIHASNPSFYDVFVADADAITFAFDPPTSPKGENLLGLDFSDRQYFHDVIRSKKPLISDVILGRGGMNFPIICFVVPVLASDPEQSFAGFALGSFDVRKLSSNLELLISDPNFKVTLSDTKGMVITSTDSAVTPLTSINRYFPLGIDSNSSESLRKQLLQSENSLVKLLSGNNYYGSMLFAPSLGWRVYVETNVLHYAQHASDSTIQIFCVLLAITLAGIGLSVLIIAWVNRPIEKLANITTELTKQALRPLPHAWPNSRFIEVSTLVQNFALMATSLRDKFRELRREIDKQKVTEQKLHHAMARAQAASNAKSEFLATMSHEIRTPLAAIMGYTDLLRLSFSSASDQSSALDAIYRNGQQLSELVNDLLDLSRIEAGHIAIDPIWVSIDDIIASGIEVFRCRTQAKGLVLEIIGKGRFPSHVLVDAIRLNQILNNITSNAIKFTEHGTISATFSLESNPQSAKHATFRALIEDTGIGIASEHQNKLFKPFVQADATYARRFGGTGLGLALSRKIALALQGDVKLIRSAPGCGSCFEITVQVGLNPQADLYADLNAARSTVKKSTKNSKNHQLTGIRILLVDDAPDNRALVNRVLSIYGASVKNAESGQEALNSCAENTWDIILMDMQMPVMDGFQTTKALRARGYQQPIIALTAHALPEERQQCLAAGCNDHVTKPIDWDRLVEAILRWTRKINPID